MLRASSVVRRFGAVTALRGVDVALQAGRVHALVGANGAGKSTLARILAGVDKADEGVLTLEGEPYAPRNPAQARAVGVAMIHQELSIAPHLSVAANIVLGSETRRFGVLQQARDHARARTALQRLGRSDLPLQQLAGELPTALQQVVELARALASDVRVLLLDEPTSSLEHHDKQSLLNLVDALRAQDLALVWIGHHLDEVLRVADDLTVLRDGAVVARHVRGVSADQLVHDMSGRTLQGAFEARSSSTSKELLVLRDFRPRHFRQPVNLTVHQGEIVGLAGLVGSGRSRLLRAIVGALPHDQGSAVLNGQVVARDPHHSAHHGLGLVAEDRKRDGLCLTIPIIDEVTLSRPEQEAVAGVLRSGPRQQAVRTYSAMVGAKLASLHAGAQTLSGGNQQKLALARLLHMQAKLWLLDDPTRGIDVAAKSDIYQAVRSKAAQGYGVLVASSDTNELLQWCDRIAVLSRGSIVDIRPTHEWDADSILACAAGARGMREEPWSSYEQ